MLEEAFGKAKNLLASAMYYPYRMMTILKMVVILMFRKKKTKEMSISSLS